MSEIARHRASGLSMPLAIQRAVGNVKRNESSVFAGLRRSHPGMVPQLMRKPALLALTRAIEDECCAQAERPWLFACFQRERFYRKSESRWVELSRTARTAIVFADFTQPAPHTHQPLEVSVPYEAPINREWVLVCDSPDRPACVVGWERPGKSTGTDNDTSTDAARRFETLWTVDPRAVRDAARICAALSEEFRPRHPQARWDELAETPPNPSPDLRRASGLLNRTVRYLTASSQRR